MKAILNSYLKINLLVRILAGLILGAVAGLVFGPAVAVVGPAGDIFVSLLKMIVMPVVISTLVVGAGSIHPAQLGRVGVKALGIYMVTTAFAVALGLVFGNLFKPGQGMDLAGTGMVTGMKTGAMEPTSPMDIIMGIVPTNPFAAITSGNILSTIFFCLIFGVAIANLRQNRDERIRRAGDTLFRFFEGFAEVMYLVVSWILQYAPIGVFALIAVVFGKQGTAAFGPLGMTTLALYLAFATHILLIYGSGLLLFRLSPVEFLKKAREAMVTGFVTRSSGGTLPVSMEVAEKEMGGDKGVYSFSLPLGATINMDGTAIYQGVCAIFIGFAIGAPLDFSQQLTIIATAVLASIGTAGVPGAGSIMLMMVLTSVGLDVEPGTPVAMAYAMIFGIDALLDMGRTATNITGDLTVTCMVARSEKALDLSRWKPGA
ncbi:MAG: dicarboxylate/amino acid:cation symporter [Desulfobacterales bacterium]|nr:dicarboxylate/amino acid:cation symporter [Desulfobacterales bacterium]